MKINVVTIKAEFKCCRCYSFIYRCDSCKKEFSLGQKIECFKNFSKNLVKPYKHYCPECAVKVLSKICTEEKEK